MATKTVSLRISEKLYNELHEQSIKQTVTITKLFWAMCNNPAMRDAETENLEQENIETSGVDDVKPEMKIEVVKNTRNKYVYVETNREKNNIIKWLGKNGIFLDDNSRIDWVYNNNRRTKIIVNGKIILNKVFYDDYINERD